MPQRPKPEVRQSFADAAKVLFAERGFRNASMRDIAARAGGTLGNLRAYFPTKNDVFEAACGAVADQVDAAIGRARALPLSQDDADRRSTDHALVQAVVTFVVEHRGALRLLLERSDGSARAGWADRVRRSYVELEVERLAAYVEALPHRFRRIPSPQLVQAICRMYLGSAEDFVRGEIDEAEFRAIVGELDAFRHAGSAVYLEEEP